MFGNNPACKEEKPPVNGRRPETWDRQATGWKKDTKPDGSCPIDEKVLLISPVSKAAWK